MAVGSKADDQAARHKGQGQGQVDRLSVSVDALLSAHSRTRAARRK